MALKRGMILCNNAFHPHSSIALYLYCIFRKRTKKHYKSDVGRKKTKNDGEAGQSTPSNMLSTSPGPITRR